MAQVSKAPLELLSIDAIQIGIRRRQKLGPLGSLKRSIQARGLIHPILVRDGHQLVSGQRRLEACRALGWAKIPARRVDRLSDDELRALELDENTERVDLLDYETSKQRLAEIRQAEAEAKEEAAVSAQRGPKPKSGPKGGRPREAGSRRDVAERTGMSRAEQHRTERHVELAERFPFMQRAGWVQHHVLEAGEHLERLPAKDYAAIASLLDQTAIPPKKAIGILENLGRMDSARRAEIYAMGKSEDFHERENALARAAALPPIPDPALVHLTEARDRLRRAAQVCRVAGLRSKVEAVSETVNELVASLQKATGGHAV